jgi:DNA polymerase zeta
VKSHLKDLPHVTPTGAAFCRASTREGVLPIMLREILETRFMVKKAMKRCIGGKSTLPISKQKTLQNVLHARQYALKMIANVTYGYTAASFTGRMPCAELADAIVKAARNTLEHAIMMVESETEKWSNAKVVYGDTDSMFVHLPGRNMKQAFEIGRSIAKAVSDANPKDVVLKFEKVNLSEYFILSLLSWCCLLLCCLCTGV